MASATQRRMLRLGLLVCSRIPPIRRLLFAESAPATSIATGPVVKDSWASDHDDTEPAPRERDDSNNFMRLEVLAVARVAIEGVRHDGLYP